MRAIVFLPVVSRELRVAARRRQTYWHRFFTALFALATCGWVWGWIASDLPSHSRGQVLFRVVAGLAFAFCLLAGVIITADCLSEEKREGTMGLLFLTDLRGYDVVLGKLAATSLNAFYGLAAVFPVLAIPLLLGGMTGGELSRMALALINTLYFSLSAGIFISAISRQERQAIAGTILLILLVVAGPPAIGGVIAYYDRAQPYNPLWLVSSGVYPAVLATDLMFSTHVAQYWISLGVMHALAWFFLVGAIWATPRTWQDRPAVKANASLPQRWRAWQFGRNPGGRALRTRLLDLNPIIWLCARDRLRRVYPWGALGVVAAFWLSLYLRHGELLLDVTIYFLIGYSSHTVLKLLIASEACRPLFEDRQSGALELLLSTPLTAPEILSGYAQALGRQFGWPTAVALGADIVMLQAGTIGNLTDVSDEWLLSCVGMMVLFILDLITLGQVGLWLSLRAKKVSRAIAATIAWVLVLPWVLLIVAVTVLATLQSPSLGPSEARLLIAAFLLAVTTDIALLSWSGLNLRRSFRSAAGERFGSGAPVTPDVPSPTIPSPLTGMAGSRTPGVQS